MCESEGADESAGQPETKPESGLAGALSTPETASRPPHSPAPASTSDGIARRLSFSSPSGMPTPPPQEPREEIPSPPLPSPTPPDFETPPQAGLPKAESSKWGFTFHAPKNKAQSIQEPVEPFLAKLHNAQDEDQVLDVLWPPYLFQNMRTCDEIFDTIQSKLSEIWQDTRTHREIALDSEFTLSKVFPRPFYKAAEAVALHNGWHLESFMLSLLNNLPFIEHRATRLTPTAGKQLEQLVQIPAVTSSAPPPKDGDTESNGAKRRKTEDTEESNEQAEARDAQDPDLQAWLQEASKMYGADGLLSVKPGEYVHQISPGIPVMLAGPASSRKSSQCEFTRSLLQAR